MNHPKVDQVKKTGKVFLSRVAGCLLLILLSETLFAESIALISDLNGRYGSISYHQRVGDAVEAIIELQPDLVVCTGDMIAGQQQPRLDQDWLDRMWAGFNLTLADPFRRAGIPLLVTPGNHDGSAYPEYALERQRFAAQWDARVPELEMLDGSHWARHYAARSGSILLLGFDGTRTGPLPPEELRFVEENLQKFGSDASVTMVFSHLPMWPLTEGREHEIIDDPALLQVLHRHGVDVYASGHHHAFFAGTDDAGMIHVGNGSLGGNTRVFSGQKQRQPHSFTILTVEDGLVSVVSSAAPNFAEAVSADRLPASISGPLGTLKRIDGPVALRP